MKRWFFGFGVAASLGLAAVGGDAKLSAAGPHDYFNMLLSHTGYQQSTSFRDVTQLAHPNEGGLASSNDRTLGLFITYDPAKDTDPHKQDAAKVVIPAFTAESASRSVLAEAVDAADTTLGISVAGNPNLVSLMAKGATLKLDNELLLIAAYDNTTRTVTVARGAQGSSAASHKAGAPFMRSNNSVPNQVRVPIDTENGHSYVFTWDGYWTDSYVGSGLGAHKTFQLTSGGDNTWLEWRTRFDGGTKAYELPGLFSGFTDVASVDLRTYNTIGGGATWSAADVNKAGPIVTRDQPLEPRTATRTFVIKPNRWTRFWARIDQRANDYDYVDMWMADEQMEAVQLYSRVPLSIRANNRSGAETLDKFWLEYNASDDKHVRGDERPLVAYIRNFVVLRDVANIQNLLTRPGDAPSTSSGPAAPRNVRIVR